jgi:hypothetical protein
MADLEQEFHSLYNDLIPSGLRKLVDEMKIDMELYKADIIGSVSSHLKGAEVDLITIKYNDELGMRLELRLEACMEKLEELIEYKKRIDALAELLKEEIN